MMKKLFPILFALALLLTAACAEDSALPVFLWEHDGLNHWQLDAAGVPVNQGAHTLREEDLRCTVCDAEVLDWGDGAIDVTDYDAYGNTLRYTSFENGEKTYESIHAFTYDEAGVVLVDREYIDGARMKGVKESVVVIRHALRNSLIPVVTGVGMQLGTILGGTVVVETVFTWPGMGMLLVTAAKQRDFPTVQYGILLVAASVTIVNILIDISYGYLDPRIREDFK